LIRQIPIREECNDFAQESIAAVDRPRGARNAGGWCVPELGSLANAAF
jgi:hypothetical protein